MRGKKGQVESYCRVDEDLFKVRVRALEGRDVDKLRTDAVVTELAMFKDNGAFFLVSVLVSNTSGQET